MDSMPARAVAFFLRWARVGREHMPGINDQTCGPRQEVISIEYPGETGHRDELQLAQCAETCPAATQSILT